MRTLNSSWVIAIALFVASCCKSRSINATFTDPQPVETPDLSKFPKRVRGEYLNLSSNSVLKLTDNGVYIIYDTDNKEHIKDIDSSSVLIGDSLLVCKTAGIQFPVVRKGDTLIYHQHLVDTLFQMGRNTVAREYRGDFFLNNKAEDGWSVNKLSYKNGRVTLSYIADSPDVAVLKEISESTLDSIPHRFKTTKAEFRQFIKRHGFSTIDTFVLKSKI